jgi:hypothetical protein
VPPTRSAALRALKAEELADLLRRAPEVVAALRGEGPLARPRYERGQLRLEPAEPRPEVLAELLARRPSLHAVVSSLDRFSLQLLSLAAWHGGALTHQQALAEVGEEHGLALKRTRNLLERLLLVTHSGRDWLALRPDVDSVLGLPGPRVRPAVAALPAQRVGDMLALLGEHPIPARKDERVDRIEALLRDPFRIREVVAALPARVTDVFTALADGEPLPLDDRELWPALEWLSDRALVGQDLYSGEATVFRDVVAGLHGHLYCHWSSGPPDLDPQPLALVPTGLPHALRTLDGMLAAFEADPPASLAAGGLGARPITSLAKSLGQPAGTVGLLAALVRDLGLVAETVTDPGRTTGRGQNRRLVGQQRAWRVTALLKRWSAAGVPERWARLVHAWRGATAFSELAGLPEKLPVPDYEAQQEAREAPGVRAAVLDVLVGLPEGMGTSPTALAEAADHARPALLRGRRVDGVIAALRALGLAPEEGPIGLTPLARTLLAEGPDALGTLLPPPRRAVTVQADRTVIAPPDLAPDLAARLERYGEREADAVVRLGERRVSAALDAGETVEGIVAFLAEHSTAEVPQPVRYWLDDLGRRHGRLRVGGATTYLRCDDPAVLAGAVAVKAAKLRALAPTVAVTSLPAEKLLAVLRAKGLLPVAESADGTVLRAAPAREVRAPTADLPPLPVPDRGDQEKTLLELARTILR